MTTLYILLFVAVVILLTASIGLSSYTIMKDTRNAETMFKIQMESAKKLARPDIHKLPYAELMKIVNETIDYYTSLNLDVLSLSNKGSDEISIALDSLIIDISTKVKISVSPHVTECITAYVSEDFYDKYIFNSVRLLTMANIEKRRTSPVPRKRIVPSKK